MQELISRIKQDGKYIGNGILKVDAFINHQVDTKMMARISREFVRLFEASGVSLGEITKVITAEVSGIAPAQFTAEVLGVPMVFARKIRPATLNTACYSAETVSRTKQETVTLSIAKYLLRSYDNVIIIDDFLAKGACLEALVDIVQSSGADIHGIGCIIEKVFEGGRDRFPSLPFPLISLVKLYLEAGKLVIR